MRLYTPFVRLALTVDAGSLAAEVAALPADAWLAHPDGIPGNSAVPLVSSAGDINDDSTTGPMRPTPWLSRMPYHRAVLTALGAPIGRARLMRIVREGSLGAHVDINRYWQEHVRVHVPVLTDPAVEFLCGDEQVHMAAGEVWVFDTWRRHAVNNPAGIDRVHLVIDTVGSAAMWDLVTRGHTYGIAGAPTGGSVVDRGISPTFELTAAARVTSPWQQASLVQGLLADLGPEAPAPTRQALAAFVEDWRALWAERGETPEAYDELLARLSATAETLVPAQLPNGTALRDAIRQLLVLPATTKDTSVTQAPAQQKRSQRRLERPVFIVCPPRSGSSLLFETLTRAAGVHTIGGESHQVFESIPELRPANRDWSSNSLQAEDATPQVVRMLDETFAAQAHDRDGRPPRGLAPIRLLEKTPKNALRVSFLAAAFPDATFVYLHRDPRAAISSMLDAWHSGRFVTYPNLPGWQGLPWSLALIPGWRSLIGRPLEEVVSQQWATTTQVLLDDLSKLAPDRWCITSHEQLLAAPDSEARRLCDLLGLAWDRPVLAPLPLSRTTLDAPDPQKWLRNADSVASTRNRWGPVADRAAAVLAEPHPVPTSSQWSSGTGLQPTAVADPTVFASVHTSAVPELLAKAGSSLVVSTYQTGRLVLVRTSTDGTLNTHLRAFPRPMGVAASPRRMAVGTSNAVWLFDDRPGLSSRLPGGSTATDACFVPSGSHLTGDISVHEMAWADDGELWVVNTRFSCLATLDGRHSFVPRWRPPFVSHYAAEDRCHLNGLAMVDGRPGYVTALATTDEAQGWRREKVGGGVVVDVATGEVVARGLTMPHSPRWHDGRLWVLDSGKGSLATVDPASGRIETVALLPGFTRGLTFIGRYAVVGLSTVREHVFAGLPLAARVEERQCGLWVVDTQTAEIVGFLRFTGGVDEVFDVQLLAGRRHPDLLEPDDPIAAGSFVLPEAALPDTLGVSR